MDVAIAAGWNPECAEAWVLGARLDLRAFEAEELLGRSPDTYALAGGGLVSVFRYGVAVFFGASEAEQAAWVERLRPFVTAPIAPPERDSLEIRVDEESREGLDARGVLTLNAATVERLQVVGHVMAKSTVLAHYEVRVAEGFARVEARSQLPALRPSRRQSRELLQEIREALAVRVQTVGRAETTEKPEIVWDRPDLDRLYDLLAVEFELRERDAALSRKLHLLSESAATSLELIHTRQGLRVEWYIVILIAVEIALILYDMAVS